MHRIGIISDTHGLLRPEVREALMDCEIILHGGDINSSEVLDELNGIASTYAVRGNCDKNWGKYLPETFSIELYGVRFFMVHNRKHIPISLDNVDIVIYGHSHKYEEKYEGGRLMLNPGSCGPRRFTLPITFAILEIEDDRSLRVNKKEIQYRQESAGSLSAQPKAEEHCIIGRDMKRIVKGVMRDTDRRIPVAEIAVRNNISIETAEQICRLYLTHPGVSADGILGKMGL